MQTDQQTPATQIVAPHAAKADKESVKATKYRKEIRLSPRDTDVERIVENWNVTGDGSRNVAAAIRLFDAVIRGDLDAVRQQQPLLAPALAVTIQMDKPRKKQVPSPDLESLSIKDSKDKEIQNQGKTPEQIEFDLRMIETKAVLSEVTGLDPDLQKRQLAYATDLIVRAGYLPEDVLYWYNNWWLHVDWRGRQGEQPDLDLVRKHLGKVKALRLKMRDNDWGVDDAAFQEWCEGQQPRAVEMEATWPPERPPLHTPDIRTEGQIKWDKRQARMHFEPAEEWERNLP